MERPGWVSILVLLDDAYRRLDHTVETELLIEFQSLFFWMMPTGKSLLGFSLPQIPVSILVLLDDAYRLVPRWDQDPDLEKFQSLFFWMMPTGLPMLLLR